MNHADKKTIKHIFNDKSYTQKPYFAPAVLRRGDVYNGRAGLWDATNQCEAPV